MVTQSVTIWMFNRSILRKITFYSTENRQTNMKISKSSRTAIEKNILIQKYVLFSNIFNQDELLFKKFSFLINCFDAINVRDFLYLTKVILLPSFLPSTIKSYFIYIQA